MSKTVHQTKKINVTLIIIGLLLFFGFIFFVELQPEKPQVTYTAAIAILMGFWWVTEAIPVAATSLLPLVLFPLLGISDGETVSQSYINYIIFLYIGGFIMALTIEKWNLHRRIALKILSIAGASPFRILFGFMFSTAFLSMWMSNTATAMMMLPIGFSVISTLHEIHAEEKLENYSSGVLLSIAYASTIGGIATLVGTPPNLSLVRIYQIMFPNGEEITFGNWFLFAFPLAVCLFISAFFCLYFFYRPKEKMPYLPNTFFKERYKALGKTSWEEKIVFLLFVILIFLWIFRKSMMIGNFKTPGWSDGLANGNYINDGTVAIFIALLLFIIPSAKKNEALIDWEVAKKIPWHIVLLFGGGFALAKGFIDSGLSQYFGSLLTNTNDFSPFNMIALLTGLMCVLSEFTSNTAITEMMLPIIGGLASELKLNPLLLMLPATLAASTAFMLPIATPPNAIVYGTGKLTIKQMVFTGFALNCISIILISVFTYFWGSIVFGI
jgi:solute carrier family 13 (sodium-dependent dicarboxylate transporter), member 2/3/5